MKVVVTGGGGFLGSHLVERLERDDHDVVVARQAEYDLTSSDDAAQLFEDTKPELVFHLAAEVGGIGANRANPGRYWYANLAMGVNVLEQARLHETGKLVISGTVCAYPKFARPVSRGRTLGRISRGDERAVRRREEGRPRRRAGLSRAVRTEHGLPAAHEPVRPARQLRPGDLTRDPRADPQDGRGGGRGRPLGRRLPLASSSTSTTASRGSSWPPSATTARSRRTSVLGRRSPSASSPSSSPRRRATTALSRGTRPSPMASRAVASTRAGHASSSGSRRRPSCATGSSEPLPGTARTAPHVSVASTSVAAAREASRTVDVLLERPRAVLATLASFQLVARCCSPPRCPTTAGSGSTTATRSGSRRRAGCSGTSSSLRRSSATSGRSSSHRSCGSLVRRSSKRSRRSWR